MTTTTHFQKDRADRYAFIVTNVGLGKVVHSYTYEVDKYGKECCTVNITSTGVAMVMAKDGTLITMYVLTITEAKKYFKDEVVPMLLGAIIKKNMKNRFHTLQNQIKYQNCGLAEWEK